MFFPRFSVFNASGPLCTTLEELENIARSEADYIMTKSCSIEPREGNPTPRYHLMENSSINSMGLPNLGYRKYIEFSHILKEKYKKPIIASLVTIKSSDEFLTLMEAFEKESAVDAVELSFSCPNVAGKSQVGYDPVASRAILEKVCRLKNRLAIGIKMTPYFDFAHYDEMAKVLLDFPVDFITCINSVGNTLVLDPTTHRPVIKPRGGFGGLGGAVIKPVALANARRFYELIGDKIQIVGCGGVVNGIDAYEYSLCGASAVQIATEYDRVGPGIFAQVKQEAETYAQSQGWASIDEAKGKLEVL